MMLSKQPSTISVPVKMTPQHADQCANMRTHHLPCPIATGDAWPASLSKVRLLQCIHLSCPHDVISIHNSTGLLYRNE